MVTKYLKFTYTPVSWNPLWYFDRKGSHGKVFYVTECTICSLVVKVYRLIWFNIRTSGRVIELSIERSGFIRGVEYDLLRDL